MVASDGDFHGVLLPFVLEFMIDRPAVFIGHKIFIAQTAQQRLPVPDGAAHILRCVGIAAQGDEFSAQIAVKLQNLPVGQGRVAPVRVQFDADALGNDALKQGRQLVFKSRKVMRMPKFSLK